MKIIQVVPTIRKDDGMGQVIRRLSMYMAEKGHDVRIHVIPPLTVENFGKVRVTVHPKLPFLHERGISPQMRRALLADATDAQILHTHGMWMMPHVYPGEVRKKRPVRLMFSPRGTLAKAALKWGRWKKSLFYIAFQRHTVLNADVVHATSEKEYNEIREFGVRQPIAIIPNDVVFSDVVPSGKRKRALYLGRLHPLKGLEPLVRAWAQVESGLPDWELWIVGPSEIGHREYLEKIVKTLNVKRVVISDPKYGKEKSELLSSAMVGVYPSFSENFGNAVAESAAHATAVLVSGGTPWVQVVRDLKVGWFFGENMAESLRSTLSRPEEELIAAGKRGRAWVESNFRSSTVFDRFLTTYEWMLAGGAKPEWVQEC